MKEFDLFGEEVLEKEKIRVNVYADEIQEIQDQITGARWIYIGTLFERVNKPILPLILDQRYIKSKSGWEDFKEKNDRLVHWAEIRSADQKNIIERWVKSTFCNDDFYFSILGINLTNLNVKEFGEVNNFNVIYNRFFRTNLVYALKKFFGKGVVVENIYHEEGQQQHSKYFDWHTIFKLEKDEFINFKCRKVIYLPKHHQADEKSNLIQLVDVYLGAFKDLHLGIGHEVGGGKPFKEYKQGLIEILRPLFERVVKNPNNIKSSYRYARRINISLFPKTKTSTHDLKRPLNNFYEPEEVSFSYIEQQNP